MNEETHSRSQLLEDILYIVEHPDANKERLVNGYRKDKKLVAFLKKLHKKLNARFYKRKDVEKSINKANNHLLRFAQHRYNKELQLCDDDTFNTLFTSLNFLGQELNYSTVTTHYLNDVFNSIGDIVLVINKVGSILHVNSAGYDVLGYKQDELKDMNVEMILESGGNLNELLETQKTQFPVNFITSSGKSLPVSLKISNFQRVDNPMMGYVVIARDLSVILKHQQEIEKKNKQILLANKSLEKARDKAEENSYMHRFLMENMTDGVVYFDAHGKIIYANDAASRIFHLPMNQLLGKSFSESHWTAKREDGSAIPFKEYPFQLSLATGKPVENFIMCVFFPGLPDCKWIRVNSLPRFSGDKKSINLVIATFEDITHEKNAEKEREIKEVLEKKVILAEESLKFKQKFLANMSHEIRTPLAGILGISEALSKTELGEQQSEFVKILQVSGESLRGIINDVLDYSKIEAGKIQLQKSVFSLKETMKSACDLFMNITYKDIGLNYNFSDNLPDYIEADELRIGQVIRNLVSNAVKFTEKGSITVSASLNNQSKQDNDNVVELKVEVADTGIGIRESKLNELFKPFVQLDDNGQRKSDGTGLGLSISKEIVHMHGGEIGVVSEVGKGSTFWFTFRAKMAAKPSLQSQGKPDKKSDIKNLQILLVEDNIINQKVFSISLKYLGHSVTLADNGLQALEKVKACNFDLILMDVQMPVMDGITATNQLKQLYEDLPPIVGLSANALEGDREKYIELGMDDYLTKPLVEEDFLELLEKLF